MFDEAKTDSDPSQTWEYFTKLREGGEHDELGQDWFNAGHVDTVSFSDENSIQALHQHLDSFNKAIKDSPGDMRYMFVVEPTRPSITPENANYDVGDLIITIKPTADNVTLDDLSKFTSKIKSV